MLGRFSTLLVVALIGCSTLAGCSSMSMSKSVRRQAAYARYVSKYSHNRVKQQTKFKRVKVPSSSPSKGVAKASTSDAPQSMTTGGESQSSGQ